MLRYHSIIGENKMWIKKPETLTKKNVKKEQCQQQCVVSQTHQTSIKQMVGQMAQNGSLQASMASQRIGLTAKQAQSLSKHGKAIEVPTFSNVDNQIELPRGVTIL